MKANNSTNLVKSIFFVSVLLIGSLGLLMPLVDAAHPAGKDSVTKVLTTGAVNEFSFRDISNTAMQTDADGNSVSTVTLTAGFNGIQVFYTITVTDADANLDLEGIDVVLSSMTSTSSGTEKAKILVVNAGATLFDGTPAENKRVFFGAQYFDKLNDLGVALFDQALYWAAN